MSLIHIQMKKSVLRRAGFNVKQNQGESGCVGVLKYLTTLLNNNTTLE